MPAAAWSAAGVSWPPSAIDVIVAAAAAVFGLPTELLALAFRFVAAMSVAGGDLLLLLLLAAMSVAGGFVVVGAAAAAAAVVC